MTRRVFRRRIYRSPAALVADFRYMIKRRALIRRAMSELISPAFRERLMMVVTEVNGCRYCSYYHAREALKSGISAAELAALLAGQIPAGAPAGEHVALTYAQHGAETDAHPDL